MKKATPPPRRPKARKTRTKPAAAPAKRPSEVLPDRRAMEGFMAGLFGRVAANANGAVDDAQEMMSDAWEASGAERVAPARAERQSVWWGTSVSVRVSPGGCR